MRSSRKMSVCEFTGEQALGPTIVKLRECIGARPKLAADFEFLKRCEPLRSDYFPLRSWEVSSAA
jgi:hypothetical protein